MQKEIDTTNVALDALTFGLDYQLTENLIIHQPTLYEIRKYGIEKYIRDMLTLTSRPYDNMVLLYDLGLDYRKIDEFIFFTQMVMPLMDSKLSRLLFGDLSFNDYILIPNQKKELMLYNGITCDTVDKNTYSEVMKFLRRMCFFSEDLKYNVANDITYEFIVKRERRRLKKLSTLPHKEYTLLNDMASYLVWCSNGSYDFNTVQNLTWYQLYEGIKRTQADQHFAAINQGILNGTVDSSKINYENIEPLRHFDNKERKIET